MGDLFGRLVLRDLKLDIQVDHMLCFKAVSTCEILKFCNPNIISNYLTAIGNRVFVLQI